MDHRLTPEIATRFAEAALGHVTREFPHKLDHVINDAADALPPRALHPIFFGSFDWHSCVHGYWLLLHVLRLYPDLPAGRRIASLANEALTRENVAGELAYLDRSHSGGFERPYGWAWLLALHGEASRQDTGWADALQPLARAFASRFGEFLPRQTYPIRTGTHFNTAFALVLAGEWASAHDPALARLIRSRSIDYFASDRDCQAWEPGGDEFLSPALLEAFCMQRALDQPEFRIWLTAFLPGLGNGRPETLFVPAHVSDRSDGKIAHLDGLNLSRAWCWRRLVNDLPPDLADVANLTADRHLAASLPYVTGDYMGEHWLATFALLALSEGGAAGPTPLVAE